MNRRFKKGHWKCSKDCESCEGKGYVITGQEGFVNSRLEQDCRDVKEPCESAEWVEYDPSDRRDE